MSGTLRAPGDKPRFSAAGWAGEKAAQIDATRNRDTALHLSQDAGGDLSTFI